MFKHQGFTLIELLVVVAVLALVSATALLAIPDGGRKQLEEEALRMESLLEIARAQSRSSGVAVYLHVQPQGFRFEGTDAVHKLSGGWLHEATSASPQMLLLGPEPVIAPQQLRLQGAAEHQLVLASDGVRPFAVQAP